LPFQTEKMHTLNLPSYSFRIREAAGRHEIFDNNRKKFVSLTPEEWVRQNFVQFLLQEKGVPESLIAIEKKLVYNTMTKRADILVYSGKGTPLLMVECKSASIELTQKVFDQIARYNIVLRVPFLIITNGLRHLCCVINFEDGTYHFPEQIPMYAQMNEKVTTGI
jgi:type I site-specific restriction endonuclease